MLYKFDGDTGKDFNEVKFKAYVNRNWEFITKTIVVSYGKQSSLIVNQ